MTIQYLLFMWKVRSPKWHNIYVTRSFSLKSQCISITPFTKIRPKTTTHHRSPALATPAASFSVLRFLRSGSPVVSGFDDVDDGPEASASAGQGRLSCIMMKRRKVLRRDLVMKLQQTTHFTLWPAPRLGCVVQFLEGVLTVESWKMMFCLFLEVKLKTGTMQLGLEKGGRNA